MAVRCLSLKLLKNRNIFGPFMPLSGRGQRVARDFHLQTCIRCSNNHGTGDQEKGVRQFSKDSVGTELYFEEIFEHGFREDPLSDLRKYFYPESDDPIVIQLSNAVCVKEVLEVVTSLDNPSHEHITQVKNELHCLSNV